MKIDLSADVLQRAQSFLDCGQYTTINDVFRAALDALDQTHGDVTAIQEGIEDEAAGRVRPAREVLAKLQKRQSTSQKRRPNNKALEKWLADFTAWADSHKPTGHFVDDSRDSIYD